MTMPVPVPARVGVLGVGRMGTRHLRALLQRIDVVVSAVADPSPTAQANAAAIVATVAAGSTPQVYLDLEGLLANEALDAVVIATPPSLHARHCLMALEANVGVLVEKPIAVRAEDALPILTALERAHVPFLVGHIERFNPAVRALIEQVHKDRERPSLIETWRYGPAPSHMADIGVGPDLAVHDVDLVCQLVGEGPVSVMGNRGSGTAEKPLLEGELTFATGTAARVSAGWYADRRQRQIAVHWGDRRLEVDCLRQEVRWYDPGGVPRVVHVSGDPLVAEHDAFLEALASGTRSPVSGRDGLRALIIVEALMASSIDEMRVALAP
jgi:predicted dehydrogenase